MRKLLLKFVRFALLLLFVIAMGRFTIAVESGLVPLTLGGAALTLAIINVRLQTTRTRRIGSRLLSSVRGITIASGLSMLFSFFALFLNEKNQEHRANVVQARQEALSVSGEVVQLLRISGNDYLLEDANNDRLVVSFPSSHMRHQEWVLFTEGDLIRLAVANQCSDCWSQWQWLIPKRINRYSLGGA